MNLQEFNDQHKYCPICENQLVTGFHSTRMQSIRYEDNRLTFTFILNSLNKGQKDYKVSYSFGLLDNSFYTEFYTYDGATRYHTEVPEFLRTRFLTLHNNLKKTGFKFFRGCTSCRQYVYASKYFSIDLKTASHEPLEVWSESVGLVHPLEDGKFRIYQLINMLKENKSTLCFWKNNEGYVNLEAGYLYKNATILNLPLIPFVSKEETTNRLNNLIIFT